MKKVIEGKVYDTTTADHICDLPCDTQWTSDFRWHSTRLYRSPKGTYFVAGRGGPLSMWAESIEGGRGRTGSSGIRLVDADEAREFAEEAGLDADEMESAGFKVEVG